MFRFLIIIILYTQLCYTQENFKYKKIDYERNHILYDEENIVELPKSSLTENFVENTNIINRYLKNNRVVKLPNVKIVIDKSGLDLNSNNVLIFDKNTSLSIIENDLENYQVLRIHNVKNVQIYNPTIIGDRLIHTGNKGEWGHGISILSAKNIKIFNYKVEKCWGDGVYIGKSNRRNGISITSAKDVIIQFLVSSNTNGTFPMYGLVIEPNNNDDLIENIFIKNIKTYNNKEGGVNININKLGRGKNKKQITINIDNFQDYYSKVGFLNSNISINPENFHGIIQLSNFELYYNTTPVIFKSSNAENLVLKIQNIDWKLQKRKDFTKSDFINTIKKRKDLIYTK